MSASYVGDEPSQTGTNGSVLLQEKVNKAMAEANSTCLNFISDFLLQRLKLRGYFAQFKLA